MNDSRTAHLSAKLEAARRAKMTPNQVADEIAAVLQELHFEGKPKTDSASALAYSKAWINGGGIICLHGLMIVEALRKMASHE